MDGFTFYVVIGNYGGWKIIQDGPAIRITLGWIGISFGLWDIEMEMMNFIKAYRKLEAENTKLANDDQDLQQEIVLRYAGKGICKYGYDRKACALDCKEECPFRDKR